MSSTDTQRVAEVVFLDGTTRSIQFKRFYKLENGAVLLVGKYDQATMIGANAYQSINFKMAPEDFEQ